MIIEHPVKTRADFARLKRGFAFQPGRFAAGWKEQALRQFKNGMGLRLSCRGFYGFPRELMGDEQLCLAMYDDPGLVHELNETYAVLLAAIADRLTQEGVPLESVYFWEDLAGNNGPLIGPGQFAEFLAPYYRRVIARFRKTGANFFQVDSDGNLQALIPNLLEAGVNGLVPCECRAGMDVVKLRALYPGLVLAGGLDKHAFVKDRAAIDKELEARVRPMLGQGGYLAMIDHRVLLGTTFADFSYYLHRAAEMLEITR
jgi:uroporphyrinogen-III decarboxylase